MHHALMYARNNEAMNYLGNCKIYKFIIRYNLLIIHKFPC